MNVQRPFRFREEVKKQEITMKDVAREIRPRARKMIGYAGRALIRK